MENVNEFIKSPIIVINDEGVACQFIELDYKPFDNFTILEIYSGDRNELLGRWEFLGKKENHLITVDRKWLHIRVVYKVRARDDYGNFVENIIDVREKNLFEKVSSFDVRDVDLERFSNLLDKVKTAMDDPEGEAVEKDEHTKLLKDSVFDRKARNYVIEKIRNIVSEEDDVDDAEIEYFVYKIYAMLYGLGVVQELDDDPEVGEIMVNAVTFPEFKADIYYVKNQKKYKYNKTFSNLQELKNVFDKTIAFSGKQMNNTTDAIIEATRPNRDRVTIVIPRASDNYSLNIRKFSNFVPDEDSMRKAGTVDDTVEQLYKILIKGKANIGIGGPMGTGKTTMINYMLTYTPKMERKVVIASVSETDVDRVLKGHDVVIFNVNEELGFTFGALVRVSLRTTADRVIIPESRGGEFKDLYEANLKTKGNMFTAHATDDESFLDMCVDMYNASPDSANEAIDAVKNKICKAIDVIVMMVRVETADEVCIRIQSISEVCTDEYGHYTHMNRLYEWEFDPENPGVGQYRATGNQISEALSVRLNRFGVKQSEIDKVNQLLINQHNKVPSLREKYNRERLSVQDGTFDIN